MSDEEVALNKAISSCHIAQKRLKAAADALGDRYYFTQHWLATRDAKRKQQRYKCEKCGSGKKLHVHHLTYTSKGREPLSDLQLLCEKCHHTVHGRTAETHTGPKREKKKRTKREGKKKVTFERKASKKPKIEVPRTIPEGMINKFLGKSLSQEECSLEGAEALNQEYLDALERDH